MSMDSQENRGPATRDRSVALVVNDDVTQLRILSDWLQQAGIDARAFEKADDALAALCPFSPPDLIIIDLSLPGVDGWCFSRILQSMDDQPIANVPILAICDTYSDLEGSQIAADLGAHAFLSWPVDDRQFMGTVNDLVAGNKRRHLLRVLIVERDEPQAQSLQLFFEKRGAAVEIATTAESAQDIFRKNAFDVAAIDSFLPDGKGDELLTAFQRFRPDCACIMMTGDRNAKLPFGRLHAGAAAYLSKPFAPEYLFELCAKARKDRASLRIQELLEKRTRELRASIDRCETLLDTTGDGMAVLQDGKVVFASNHLCQILAVSPDADHLLGNHFSNLFPLDERSRITHLYHRYASGERNLGIINSKIVRPDGETIYVEINGSRYVYEGADAFLISVRDVTERHKKNLALLESEERYRRLTENADDLIWRITPSGRVQFVNSAIKTMLGYSLEESFGMSMQQYFMPESAEASQRALAKALRSDPPQKHYRLEVEYRHKDGHPVPCEASVNILFDDEGNPVGYEGISREITERKRVEEALKKSRQQLTNAMQMNRAGHWDYDVASDTFTFTDEFYQIFRTTAEKAGGYQMSSADYAMRFVHPEDSHLVAEEIGMAIQTGDPSYSRQIEHRILYADGEVGYVAVRFFILKDERGLTVRTYGVNQDITEQKRTEESVRKSEARYRLLADNSSDVIWTMNLDQQFTYVSPSVKRIFGYSVAQALENRLEDIMPPESLLMIQNKIQSVPTEAQSPSAALEPMVVEVQQYRADRSLFWTEITYTLVQDPITQEIYIQGATKDITDRKQAERALQESEEQKRAMIEANPDILLKIDDRFRFTFIHSSNPKDLLVSREMGLGRTVRELLPRELAMLTEIKIGDALATARLQQYEYSIDINGRPTFWEARMVRCSAQEVLAFVRNITEKKQAEIDLMESQKRLNLALHVAKMGYWDWFTKTHKVLWYGESAALFGMKQEDFGQTIEHVQACVHPDDRDQGMKAFSDCIEKGSPFINTYRVIHPNQEIRWLHSYGKLFKNNDGEPDHIFGITLDVTESKRAEQALRESEEKYRTLVEGTLQGVVIAQENPLKLVFANNAMSEISGYAVEELLSMEPDALALLIHADDRLRFFENFQRRIAGQPVPALDSYQILRKNGDVSWVQTYSSRIKYLDQFATLTAFVDVSDMKTAEQEKAKLQDQLVQSQKMESIGRLAGGVAHDFNNILTGINGYAEMILKRLKPDDPLLSDIKEIKSAGERAAGLTAQLLAFSRKQIISPKVVSPNDILERSQTMLRRIIGEDIELLFIPGANLNRIKVDPAQLDQILVNLAVNSRDAMPGGGKLVIETQNIHLDQEFCDSRIDVYPGDYVRIEVTDTGHGMDMETQSKIFEPFFSTKVQGTGLGLATVYGIVKQNHGYVTVSSKLNAGTIFHVYFPRVLEEADILSEDGGSDLPVGTEIVLVVEDEDMVRQLVKKILERQGYNVIEMENGRAAYAYFSEHNDPVDLLLTDVVMPSMNGKMLFDKLQKKRPHLKALFMSGYTENAIAHHGVLDEGTHFIQKPFTMGTLTRMIRTVLDSEK